MRGDGLQILLPNVHGDTRRQLMSRSASRLLEISDRCNQMVLTMAVDAARVKAKSRKARLKKEKQVAYRGVRYQRFNGRREDVMQEEVREAKRARAVRSQSSGWRCGWRRKIAPMPRRGALGHMTGTEDERASPSFSWWSPRPWPRPLR